jgi:hypothetical protein
VGLGTQSINSGTDSSIHAALTHPCCHYDFISLILKCQGVNSTNSQISSIFFAFFRTDSLISKGPTSGNVGIFDRFAGSYGPTDRPLGVISPYFIGTCALQNRGFWQCRQPEILGFDKEFPVPFSR